MNYKFEPKSTAYKLNLSNIKDESFIYELIIKLNTPTHYGINVNDSIMIYGDICTCDNGFLCHHKSIECKTKELKRISNEIIKSNNMIKRYDNIYNYLDNYERKMKINKILMRNNGYTN